MQVFDSEGFFQWTFGGVQGGGPGEFNKPVGIAVDPLGSIFVADRNNQRVQIFDNSGVYQSQFGSGGIGPGEFGAPSGLTLMRQEVST